MEKDEFAERIARVRQRFAAALPGKIDDAFAAISKLSQNDNDALETLVVTHRKLHEMCGIAPSVGFAATGVAVRAAETVLREPAKARRPLTLEEINQFEDQLAKLRDAVQSDLHSTEDSPGRG